MNAHRVATGRARLLAQLNTAEFRLIEARREVTTIAGDLSRLRAAAMDVLRALPEDRGPALRRLRFEMAGRGSRRAA